MIMKWITIFRGILEKWGIDRLYIKSYDNVLCVLDNCNFKFYKLDNADIDTLGSVVDNEELRYELKRLKELGELTKVSMVDKEVFKQVKKDFFILIQKEMEKRVSSYL